MVGKTAGATFHDQAELLICGNTGCSHNLASHNNLCFSLVNSLFLTFSFLHRDIF